MKNYLKLFAAAIFAAVVVAPVVALAQDAAAPVVETIVADESVPLWFKILAVALVPLTGVLTAALRFVAREFMKSRLARQATEAVADVVDDYAENRARDMKAAAEDGKLHDHERKDLADDALSDVKMVFDFDMWSKLLFGGDKATAEKAIRHKIERRVRSLKVADKLADRAKAAPDPSTP
jgi:hypothetical protein